MDEKTNEPAHDKTNKNCTSDQRRLRSVGHPPSLISFCCPHEESYPLSAQRRLWSDWADAQADLSLRWALMLICCFLTCSNTNIAKNSYFVLLLIVSLLNLSTLSLWNGVFPSLNLDMPIVANRDVSKKTRNIMASHVDPDETAHSGSTLFAKVSVLVYRIQSKYW